jgi:hypothetical protein
MIDQSWQILFIGPATREDAGFLHSYDVVLDSFQWEEDFSEWYKLAGSMVRLPFLYSHYRIRHTDAQSRRNI